MSGVYQLVQATPQFADVMAKLLALELQQPEEVETGNKKLNVCNEIHAAEIEGSQFGVVWCGVVWCSVCGLVCGVVWCGVVWCGVVWCSVCGLVW